VGGGGAQVRRGTLGGSPMSCDEHHGGARRPERPA
jgi:hypothetical protein